LAVITPSPRIGKFAAGPAPALPKRAAGKRKPRKLAAPKGMVSMRQPGLINR
jgi:hypothetical protein